ncbi:MAG: rhodanese-like domain-containing protein [Acidiferrobacterales bacterium]
MFGMINQSQQIECQEARDMLENHDAQLVDVRTPQEHSNGTLPGSVNVPLQFINQAHDQLDKSKPVIVYCVSGARSAQALPVLQSMGFDNVHNLGSINKYLTC